MVKRLGNLISIISLIAVTVSCGNESQNNQLSSFTEGSEQLTIATKCEEINATLGLKARLVLQVSGTKYGIKVVGWRRSAGEMEPVLGSNKQRDSFTTLKVLPTEDLCSKPVTLKGKQIDTIIKNSVKDDYFDWSEPTINSLVIKIETYKPGGLFTQLKVEQSIPLANVENNLFVAFDKAIGESVPGIGVVSIEL